MDVLTLKESCDLLKEWIKGLELCYTGSAMERVEAIAEFGVLDEKSAVKMVKNYRKILTSIEKGSN